MKRTVLLTVVSVLILFCLSGCYLVNSVFFGDEAKALTGLWLSEGWDKEEERCYYDFRPDGRVFVTDWTDDLGTTNNILVPIHFNYSLNRDGVLKFTQFMGIANFQFLLDDTADITTDQFSMTIDRVSFNFDYDNFYSGTTFTLTKVMEYTDDILFMRSLYEEDLYE
ncbi:MAG TPA: hypothetical protein DCO79_11100 [Spirochaeta sp.]|nr:hypothetical protein [Spirochaeta sp.]